MITKTKSSYFTGVSQKATLKNLNQSNKDFKLSFGENQRENRSCSGISRMRLPAAVTLSTLLSLNSGMITGNRAQAAAQTLPTEQELVDQRLDRIADVAESHIGLLNSDAEAEQHIRFPANQAWCTYFVDHTVREANEGIAPWGDVTGSSETLTSWARNNSYFDTNWSQAQRGDILLQQGHTAIITGVNESDNGAYLIHTVDGNYSNSVNANTRTSFNAGIGYIDMSDALMNMNL